MNLSSIIVLVIIAVCFYFAVKNIKNNRCKGCTGNCSKCGQHKNCNEKIKDKEY